MAELNNLFQVRESLEVQFITRIERVKLRHQFLQVSLSGDLRVILSIMADDSLR